ncbi:hypothetical protein H112_06504 [Trichophyton rubrum D6]|uniref:Uncharacterized protein n=4 Tax=Trichophyton TaxID=5550 RepID=A0A178F1D2_TRIRU|nr:uncharacterized protein TERG_01865 [Trichophyton rubrum CBS 118892]EZF12963.1 hypothetical protein H100_06520 [Trichophyton rubrum MR850]EZF39395.1 hypothetical protein H102_06487 [Trichophyton rubrum CBS 100081]EZF49979.1 hypothetical protein H103_06513 [Trichophyton rubrum CBS 288.86]EZF60629.1 hypothetical protein H104_06495 [Trichophyton rubrum CBS 289.86]EZF71258.1 hypothetical protein H105_06524 [Trichophyton soudanense CBS 452.61]EZF81951.1 hypothetical protein H110_06507 [Trichophy
MNTDTETEDRSGTPVPGSSLDPDSPMVDSPIYPRSPKINMASREVEEEEGEEEEDDDEEAFVTVAPASASPTKETVIEAMVEPRTEPRPRPKKSLIPTPKSKQVPKYIPKQTPKQTNKPCPGKDDGLSGLARELEGCTWEQLQQRFAEEMDERSRAENILQKETADLLEVFMAWSQTTTFRDEDRAYKRFKTRMDHVQKSETNLEEKKVHYANVVKAFESALALLRTE